MRPDVGQLPGMEGASMRFPAFFLCRTDELPVYENALFEIRLKSRNPQGRCPQVGSVGHLLDYRPLLEPPGGEMQ
jgi:hypothetical protein